MPCAKQSHDPIVRHCTRKTIERTGTLSERHSGRAIQAWPGAHKCSNDSTMLEHDQAEATATDAIQLGRRSRAATSLVASAVFEQQC